MRASTLWPGVFLSVLALTGTACSSGTEPEGDGSPPPLFFDDFESGLGNWAGRAAGHHAQIVPDPLDPGNHVVNFTETTGAGDVFTHQISVDPDKQYTVIFDYLGLDEPGDERDYMGGFLGVAEDIGGVHAWLCGSGGHPSAPSNCRLQDDGRWHTYSVPFSAGSLFNPMEDSVRIMMEDAAALGFVHGGSVPGDAYFDNIRVVGGNQAP